MLKKITNSLSPLWLPETPIFVETSIRLCQARIAPILTHVKTPSHQVLDYNSQARIMHRFSSRSGESAGPDKARDRGPRKRTVWYAEEADGVGTRFAGRTVRPSDFGDAVENLCIIRARPFVLFLKPLHRLAQPVAE